MTKRWWQSKIVWVNILTIIAAALPPIRDTLLQLGWSDEATVFALGLVNALLRLITSKPIERKIL